MLKHGKEVTSHTPSLLLQKDYSKHKSISGKKNNETLNKGKNEIPLSVKPMFTVYCH